VNLEFDIYEEMIEQEMDNLLQHSTSMLHIWSDEESEQQISCEHIVGDDKETIPYVDVAGQTNSERGGTS
jgi:hypothetical protein